MQSVDQMNRMAGFLMSELISQEADESTPAILERAGVSPDDVDYVFLTHCHYDHCSNLALFPNAEVVVPGHAWHFWHDQPLRVVYLHEGFLDYLGSLRSEGRLRLMDDGIIAPGLGVRWVGGHSPCSQFIYANTSQGVAVFTGDTVQMYGNLDHDDIIAICGDEEQCWQALGLARTDVNLLIPGHDPLVLTRFPGGVVA
jgi:glyoxylase-like metal-dependent hydrolase (beta-lactamase superfamily II)